MLTASRDLSWKTYILENLYYLARAGSRWRPDADRLRQLMQCREAIIGYLPRYPDQGTLNMAQRGGSMGYMLTSEVFANGQPIPAAYTCDGDNISPPLQWSNVPANTHSLALVVEDPDAPSGTFTHWLAYNIPPQAQGLAGALPQQEVLPDGTRQGRNDFGDIGYGGPCPPSGTHRYLFKLFALDSVLSLPAGASKHDLLQAVQSHTVAQTQLMGIYTRGR